MFAIPKSCDASIPPVLEPLTNTAHGTVVASRMILATEFPVIMSSPPLYAELQIPMYCEVQVDMRLPQVEPPTVRHEYSNKSLSI